ncbi:MAG TPA: cytochrome c oxidase subunit 3 [Kofleriaceae bacterium]
MTADHPHEGHDDGHGHHGSRFIQHHYDDAQHQFDSGKLGIWLFLAQEVLFFSALFVAYVLYRYHHPEIYSYAHKYLDVKYGAINTGVLIFSSLTAAWAVRAAQLGQRKLLIGCIFVTILCALGFLGIKYIEYSHKVHEHILFGKRFDPCVSSSGVPLLTKNGECAGHESTVIWNTATKGPIAGCFGEVTVDQDPRKEGAQVDCEVSESTYKLSKDASGNPKVDVLSSKPIEKRCKDPIEQILRGEHVGTHAHHDPKDFPCWRPAVQPEVCTLAFFYTVRDGEAFTAAGPFRTYDACFTEQRSKSKEAKEKQPNAVFTDCLRGPSLGFIVEYGNHETKPSGVTITAKCKAPPPPLDPGDTFADKPETLRPLEKAVQPSTRPNAHMQHEIEAAGPPPEHTSMFFTIYFAMTGLHGIHVLAGVIVFVWLLIRAIKGHFTPDYFGPVDFAALYWHIVDLIWIFLFPLLYLIH